MINIKYGSGSPRNRLHIYCFLHKSLNFKVSFFREKMNC